MGEIKQEVLELRIVTGLHKGAALTLLDATVQIGCDPLCDIVLLDEGVQEQHLRLHREAAGWRMEPGGDFMPMDVVVPIGQAALMLCRRGTDWSEPVKPSTKPLNERGPSHSKKAFYFSLLGIFLTLLLGIWWLFSNTTSRLKSNVKKLPESKLTVMKESSTDLQKQRELVTQLLKDRELKDFVEVTSDTHSIHLKGDLNKFELKRLNEVIHILKQRLSPNVSVTSEMRSIEKTLPFEIIEVVLGPVSYIKLKTGATVYVGETINGVLLNAIRPGVLEFSGARHFEILW